jgi:hypothetical protein
MRTRHCDRTRPRRAIASWALLLLGLLVAIPAWGGVRDAPGKDLQVALITYGPGAIYWERFGHDAIQIRDTVSGESVNFNYGVFDFDQKDFLLNFARGRMNYMMDADATEPEVDWYIRQGRSVRRQVLELSPKQAAKLRDYLLWNLRPENLHYRYDYYTSNCATKVRDALDRVLGGQIKSQLQTISGELTYREQTDRLMANRPWLMLLLDLGLSSYADRPLNAWQESFLPVELSHAVTHVQLANGADTSHPLVASDTLLAPNRIAPPPATPPDLRIPLGLAGLVLAFVLIYLGRSHHAVAQIFFASIASVWVFLAGLAGLFMLALWTLTTHVAGWANANLLLFNPLAFLLLAAVWRQHVSPRAHLIAWAVTVLAALALAGNLMQLLAQQNMPWILLALPVWLAILHVLRHRVRGS